MGGRFPDENSLQRAKRKGLIFPSQYDPVSRSNSAEVLKRVDKSSKYDFWNSPTRLISLNKTAGDLLSNSRKVITGGLEIEARCAGDCCYITSPAVVDHRDLYKTFLNKYKYMIQIRLCLTYAQC